MTKSTALVRAAALVLNFLQQRVGRSTEKERSTSGQRCPRSLWQAGSGCPNSSHWAGQCCCHPPALKTPDFKIATSSGGEHSDTYTGKMPLDKAFARRLQEEMLSNILRWCSPAFRKDSFLRKVRTFNAFLELLRKKTTPNKHHLGF